MLFRSVGARILFEGVKRLKEDGHKVMVLDSENILSETQLKGHKREVVNEELEQYLKKFNS